MNIEELNLDETIKADVQKLIQSETDKVRTEYTQKVKELEQYKPKEKTKEELEMEVKIKEIEDREKVIEQKEKLSKVELELKNKGINGELAKYLKTNADDLDSVIDNIVKIIGENNNSYVPRNHSEKQNSNITKEQFKSMSYIDRVNLYNNNKELYDILSK